MSFPMHFSPLNRASTTQRQLASLQGELSSVTEAAITGLKVRAPSDAPGRWHGILDLQAGVSDQPLYMQNATSAMSLLSTVDSALDEASSLMARAQEIAVQMASESYNDEDRAQAAVEVDAIRGQLIELANTGFGERYPFAGTAYDAPPFDAAGAYVGANDVPELVAGRDQRVQTGYDGSTIFPDALTALEDLSAALRLGPGSSDATRDMLPGLRAPHEVLISARVTAGFEFNDAEDAFAVAESLGQVFQEALDAEVSADPIETYTRLSELQSSYQAALQVTAQAGNSSLFDFLR